MSRPKNSEKSVNGAKTDPSIWIRAITANSEWPDKVNITYLKIIILLAADTFFRFQLLLIWINQIIFNIIRL